MTMHDHCIICGQPTDIEVGFYYGTGYVSYVIALMLSIITFLLWWILIGFSFEDKRFIFWISFNAVLLVTLQPWLMRFSRSLWISWFVRYEPTWSTTRPDDSERINTSQMNNW
jgi:hypothetical protein